MINYHNKRFRPVISSENSETTSETIFLYQQNGDVLTCNYKGDTIVEGHLIGLVNNEGLIDMRYHQINKNGELMTGICTSKPEIDAYGKIRLFENLAMDIWR